ncbi:hypothetical protein EIKCOROL_02161 [Eikenella corrodens ATCC 23834]|uniref:Uncharacterized protein n=1 Tax=Eikenella corrodens ATCC 23834 TaxID=546274 RepID=C0DXQ0_EIKCO|nr:hypothetical protein EIKCOROL_02161 [Eikenella corrodens ATCC 23834]
MQGKTDWHCRFCTNFADAALNHPERLPENAQPFSGSLLFWKQDDQPINR